MMNTRAGTDMLIAHVQLRAGICIELHLKKALLLVLLEGWFFLYSSFLFSRKLRDTV